MTSPLAMDGSNFPCKGYLTAPGAHVTAAFTSGQSASITLAGTAVHAGGSCQISLSYDQGKTFKVINSILGGCPLQSEYQFQIPSGLPSGKGVIFSWSWMNKVGNREMYQNCALVDIQGSGTQSYLDSLPAMQVANVGQGCSTIEGTEFIPVKPGTMVQYGGDYSAGASAVNGKFGAGLTGNCGNSAGSALPTTKVETPPTTTTKTSVAATTAATTPAPPQNPVAGGSACSGSGITCTGTGYTWSLCSNGVLVPMGAVAPGTICKNGAMVIAAGNVAPVATVTTSVGKRPVAPTKAATTTPANTPVNCVNKRDYRPECHDFALRCVTQGDAYQVCARGTWSSPRMLAAHEQCVDGQIGTRVTSYADSLSDQVVIARADFRCDGTGLTCTEDGKSYYICDNDEQRSVPSGMRCVSTSSGGGFVSWS